MKIMLVSMFLLAGCGGSSFTDGSVVTDDGSPDVVSTDAPTAQPDADAGVVMSAGGASSTGGREATGGAPTHTGGAPATGGVSTATGGASATGGAPTATDGAPPLVDACAPVTHIDGLGQSWQDCVPLRTCDEEQAMKACEAYCAVNGGCSCAAGSRCNSAHEVHTELLAGDIVMVWSEGVSYADEGSVFRDTVGVSCVYAGGWY